MDKAAPSVRKGGQFRSNALSGIRRSLRTLASLLGIGGRQGKQADDGQAEGLAAGALFYFLGPLGGFPPPPSPGELPP